MTQRNKYLLLLSAMLTANTTAIGGQVELIVINQTPTSFVAKTRSGQILGRIPKRTPTTIAVPLLAPNKYAVSFVGDNGINATLIDKAVRPYCPSSLLSYPCEIRREAGITQVTLKPNLFNPAV